MEILAHIESYTSSKNIHFLVIGGHAINAHGFSRQTADLDLLVSKNDKPFWIKLMSDLNYQQIQSHEVFARFKPNLIEAWPIDLMFVEQDIIEQLLKESITIDFGTCNVQVPSVLHLLALKLHALKQRQEFREDRDLIDVKQLISLGKVDEATFRQLCQKYDRVDVYEQLKKWCT